MTANPRVIGACLLAAAGLLAGAAGVYAGAPPTDPAGDAPPGPHQGFGPAHLFRQLGLSDAQNQSLHELLTTAAPALKNLHSEVHANVQKLRALTPDDPNYAAVAAEVSQANGSLTTQISTQEANLYAQMYALLTPAQKVQLADLTAKMAAGGPRSHWHEPPPHGDAPPPLN